MSKQRGNLLQPLKKNDKNYKKKFEKNIFQPTYENTRKNKAKKNFFFFKKIIYTAMLRKQKIKQKKIIFLLCFKWVEIRCIYDFFFKKKKKICFVFSCIFISGLKYIFFKFFFHNFCHFFELLLLLFILWLLCWVFFFFFFLLFFFMVIVLVEKADEPRQNFPFQKP
jgi:hypothetical protein